MTTDQAPPPSVDTEPSSFIGGFLTGFRGFLRAPAALTRYRLWHYQIIPSLISLLLSVAVLFVAWKSSRGLAEWLDEKIVIPWGWLDATVTWSIGIVAALAWIVAFIFLHKQLALVALAPFLGRLAELTVRGAEGESYRQRLSAGQAIARALKINLAGLTREIGLTLLCLALGFVPLIGPFLSAGGLLLVESRFLGLGLMDFPLEYRGLTVAESRAFVRKHAGLASGLGAGYLLLMTIPFVGWMFAPTFGTVAGSLEALEKLNSPFPQS